MELMFDPCIYMYTHSHGMCHVRKYDNICRISSLLPASSSTHVVICEKGLNLSTRCIGNPLSLENSYNKMNTFVTRQQCAHNGVPYTWKDSVYIDMTQGLLWIFGQQQLSNLRISSQWINRRFQSIHCVGHRTCWLTRLQLVHRVIQAFYRF